MENGVSLVCRWATRVLFREGVEEKDVWKISRNLIAYPRISKYARRTCYSSDEMYLPISPNISRYTHISDDTRLIKVRGTCTRKRP